VYLLSGSIFDVLKESFSAKQTNQEILYFEHDVLPKLVSSGALFVYQTDAFWSQVKTAASAVYANRHYLKKARGTSLLTVPAAAQGCTITGDVYIHPTAEVDPSAKLGPNVSIGAGVIIREGVRVRDAILLDNVELDSQSCVLNSVVGWNSYVGKWSRIEGLPVDVDPNDPSTHLQQKPLFDSEGKLEPNITILGEEVDVNDELIVRHCIVLPHKSLSKDHRNEIIL